MPWAHAQPVQQGQDSGLKGSNLARHLHKCPKQDSLLVQAGVTGCCWWWGAHHHGSTAAVLPVVGSPSRWRSDCCCGGTGSCCCSVASGVVVVGSPSPRRNGCCSDCGGSGSGGVGSRVGVPLAPGVLASGAAVPGAGVQVRQQQRQWLHQRGPMLLWRRLRVRDVANLPTTPVVAQPVPSGRGHPPKEHNLTVCGRSLY